MQAAPPLTLPALDTLEAAPLALERLEEARKTPGFIPNMYRVMAHSPGLLDA